MPDFEFTQLQYSEDRNGPWRLYIYESDGYHHGAQWFRRPPLKYPEEEIDAREAMVRALEAAVQGKEVRITDGGDCLVYHWKDRQVLYPSKEKMKTFWKEICGDEVK